MTVPSGAAPLTPSQTVGPFFGIALPWPEGQYAVPPGAPGAFWIRGRVIDGAGEPVPDALVETWQAEPTCFGRCATDTDGAFGVYTVKPVPIAAPDGGAQAPHLDLSIFARGLLDRVVTRIYFADEAEGNHSDPVLAALPATERDTLIARPSDDGYTLDIRLQGDHETVFFAL